MDDILDKIVKAETTPDYRPTVIDIGEGTRHVWDSECRYAYDFRDSNQTIRIWDERIGEYWPLTYDTAEDAIRAVNDDRNDYHGPAEQWEVTTPDNVYDTDN